MHRWSSRRGFTLVELMVVIGIIGLLMAILFPVFSTARENARQTKCKTQLMQLVTKLNQFRQANGYYPLPPQYNSGANRYEGGFSALYPDYVQELDLFICPDDQQALMNLQDCHERVYCSYNGLIDWDDADGDGETWEFLPLTSGGKAILYNYHGYTYSCELLTDGNENCESALAGFSSGYDTGPLGQITILRVQGIDSPDLSWMDVYLADGTSGANGIPDFLDVAGLRWQHFPALANRGAPDYTIVTHCPYHRKYFGDPAKEMDMIVTLSGEASSGNITDLGDPAATGVPNPADWPGATPVAAWVHQNF